MRAAELLGIAPAFRQPDQRAGQHGQAQQGAKGKPNRAPGDVVQRFPDAATLAHRHAQASGEEGVAEIDHLLPVRRDAERADADGVAAGGDAGDQILRVGRDQVVAEAQILRDFRPESDRDALPEATLILPGEGG